MTWDSVDELNRALYTFEITDKKQICSLIAIASKVSNQGTLINENLPSNYIPELRRFRPEDKWRGSGYLLMKGYEKYESLSNIIGDKNIFLIGADYVSTYYAWMSAVYSIKLCLGNSNPPLGPYSCFFGDEYATYLSNRELKRVYDILISI